MSKLTLSRDVTRAECPWLDRDYKAGDEVFLFNGATYGCIGPNGVACSEEEDANPFFELPRAALKEASKQ